MNKVELASMNNVVNNVVTTLFGYRCCNNLLTEVETGISTIVDMLVF